MKIRPKTLVATTFVLASLVAGFFWSNREAKIRRYHNNVSNNLTQLGLSLEHWVYQSNSASILSFEVGATNPVQVTGLELLLSPARRENLDIQAFNLISATYYNKHQSETGGSSDPEQFLAKQGSSMNAWALKKEFWDKVDRAKRNQEFTLSKFPLIWEKNGSPYKDRIYFMDWDFIRGILPRQEFEEQLLNCSNRIIEFAEFSND